MARAAAEGFKTPEPVVVGDGKKFYEPVQPTEFMQRLALAPINCDRSPLNSPAGGPPRRPAQHADRRPIRIEVPVDATRRRADLHAGSRSASCLDKLALPRRPPWASRALGIPWGEGHDAGGMSGPGSGNWSSRSASAGDPGGRRRGLRDREETWPSGHGIGKKRRGVLGDPVGHQHQRRHARRSRDGEHGHAAAQRRRTGRAAGGTSCSSRASCSRSPPRPIFIAGDPDRSRRPGDRPDPVVEGTPGGLRRPAQPGQSASS